MSKRTDPSPSALALWRIDLCRTALEAEQHNVLLHNAQELVKLAKKLSGGKGLRQKRRRKKRAYLSNGSELGLVSQDWIEERTKGGGRMRDTFEVAVGMQEEIYRLDRLCRRLAKRSGVRTVQIIRLRQDAEIAQSDCERLDRFCNELARQSGGRQQEIIKLRQRAEVAEAAVVALLSDDEVDRRELLARVEAAERVVEAAVKYSCGEIEHPDLFAALIDYEEEQADEVQSDADCPA